MWTEFSQRLIDWYALNARSLPWRERRDPYGVWVSEIMLQQTRVETVIPYYRRWMERFPTLQALAGASQQEVLAVWEGLGYYSRARNLHKAAQKVVAEYGGQVPADPAALRALPGVGRYTAGAIASIAFGLDEAALDGNIRRVLSRVFDLSVPARSPQGEQRLWEWAAENLPPGRASDYNQAMMDLASAICLPRAPLCLVCPLFDLCQARALGIQEERPVLAARAETPHYLVTAAIIERDEWVLIARRPPEGLLGGLWEFPGGKLQSGEDLPTCLRREIREELDAEIRVGEQLGVYRHAYTHFKVTLHAFFCRLEDNSQPHPLEASELAWVRRSALGDYPMGKIDRMISKDLGKRE